MCSPGQFGLPRNCVHRNAVLRNLFLLAAAAVSAGLSQAQNTSPGTIGRVEGNDISVEGGGVAVNNAAAGVPSVLVSNGSIVTVHSGEARLTLATGGEIAICGPAKLTLLQKGTSLTLAVNFGHIRVQLPGSADLRVFTPTVIATPIDISGASRDITIGLKLDDSLCVIATRGALQLEHQFTGEKLIVPELGEFYLSGGQLVPVAAPAGGCQCEGTSAQTQPQPRMVPSPSNQGLPAPLETTQVPFQTGPRSETFNTQPSVEFSIPAKSNEDHPLAQPLRNTVSPEAPPSVPTYTVVGPPLVFSANSPKPPPDPTPDMVLLVREARVDPEYEFSGHVEAAGFAQALQHALGEGNSTSAQPAREPAKKKRGFWSRLKDIF